MQPQFYKIISTGETYSLDKTTGKASKVDVVPPGARVLTWAGAGLPPDLQGAQMPNQKGGAMDGQGGPGGLTSIQSGGQNYPMGDYSLVKFQDNSGRVADWVWLLDNKAKTMRPFTSQQAFENAYAGNLDEAKAAIFVLHAADRGAGGSIADYETLEPNYAIQGDGSMKNPPASKSEISKAYGRPPIPQAAFDSTVKFVGGFLNMLQRVDSGIDSNFIEGLKNDPRTVASYVNAMAYGGYTPNDIFRDLKRNELISKGDNSQENIRPISASVIRSEYVKTDDGRVAATSQATKPPLKLGNFDPNIMHYDIFRMPKEAWETLVPPLEWGSPEMQAYMDKVSTSAYDISILKIEAKTESEKAVADSNWQDIKKEAEKVLGIRLSNNALEATKQIENVRETYSQRGISGSGMEAENIDDYLKNIRRTDNIERESALTEAEKQKAHHYRNFATEAEIATLTPEEKEKYGLTVPENIKRALSVEALRQKYPELSMEEIETYRSSILDKNDNYRSKLYQKKIEDLQGKIEEKTGYKKLEAFKAAKKAAEDAAKEFTDDVDSELARGKYSTTDGTQKPSTTSAVQPEDTNNAEVIDPSFKFSTVTGRANPNYKEPTAESAQNIPPPKVITPQTTSTTPQTTYTPPKTNINAQQVSSTIKDVIGKQQTPTQVAPIPKNLQKSFETLAAQKTSTATALSNRTQAPVDWSKTYMGTPTPKPDLTPSYVKPTFKEKVKSGISKVKSWF